MGIRVTREARVRIRENITRGIKVGIRGTRLDRKNPSGNKGTKKNNQLSRKNKMRLRVQKRITS